MNVFVSYYVTIVPGKPWHWERVPRSAGRIARGRCRRSASSCYPCRRRSRRDACWSTAGTSREAGCGCHISAIWSIIILKLFCIIVGSNWSIPKRDITCKRLSNLDFLSHFQLPDLARWKRCSWQTWGSWSWRHSWGRWGRAWIWQSEPWRPWSAARGWPRWYQS